MSNEQALGHTPEPGGGQATLGKPCSFWPGGGLGRGPAGERGLGASETGGGLAGSCPPQTRGATEDEGKGFPASLRRAPAAEPHGPNSGRGMPLPPLLIPGEDVFVPTGCRCMCVSMSHVGWAPLYLCSGARGMDEAGSMLTCMGTRLWVFV